MPTQDSDKRSQTLPSGKVETTSGSRDRPCQNSLPLHDRAAIFLSTAGTLNKTSLGDSMLKSLRKTAALSLAFIPLAISFSGAAIAEEFLAFKAYKNMDIYLDPIAIDGDVREFLQTNVFLKPRGNDYGARLYWLAHCSNKTLTKVKTEGLGSTGRVISTSSRTNNSSKPQVGSLEAIMVEAVCKMSPNVFSRNLPISAMPASESQDSSPSSGDAASYSGPMVSDRTSSGFNSTLNAGYSPVANRFDPPICYMQNRAGQMFDLTGLCDSAGSPVTSSFSSSGFSSGSVGSSSGGGSGSGPCDTPDDLDSRGRRCGARAASERAGGR
ncbi:hypothetical protein NDA01_21725 [Trichocoleus desertorum AS-A10]|uniref:hypothetical protein n=1 Tax=Trichocoleus desertorum TaxID=1481672 RepID=UPI00329A71D9